MPYINAANGEVITTIPTPVINRVSRRKLRRFLFEGQEGLDVRFEKVLSRVVVGGRDGLVEVHFTDGTSAKGSVVIGADGSRSKVREFLVGLENAKLRDLGLTMVNYAAGPYESEEVARRLREMYHPVVKLAHHDEMGTALLAALDIKDPNFPSTWKFQTYHSWWGAPFAKDLATPEERLQHVRDRSQHYCEPFKSMFTELPNDTILPIFAGQQWAPDEVGKWDSFGGRVTLAGDAAHSMLPHRGQGLNNAVKDAADLVAGIKKVVAGERTLADVVDEYEEEMKERGGKEVRLSYEQALKSKPDLIKESPMGVYGSSRS